MHFKPINVLLLSVSAALCLGAVYLLIGTAAYYPHVVIEASDGLNLTFLQTPRPSADECESASASIVNLVKTGCRTCRLVAQECITALTPEQVTLLSEVPLQIPSVRLPDGVVTYSAPDETYALAACKESEQQSRKNASDLVCQPPGTQRTVPASQKGATFSRPQALLAAWIATTVLMLAAYGYLSLRGRFETFASHLLNWPRRQKQALIVAVDVLSIETALWLAFALRLDSLYIPEGDVLRLFALAPLLALPTFVGFGVYRSVTRYLGMRALIGITKAVAIYSVFLGFLVYVLALENVPRTVLAIQGILTLLLIGATRVAARFWLHRSRSSSENGPVRKNVVIYGAGSAGIQLSTALDHSRELRPVAFLDDDVRLHGSRLGELEVFAPQRLKMLVDRFQVKEVLLAIPSTSRARRNEIINLLESLSVQVRTLPGLSDLAEGKIKTDDLRKIDIEDLLGRDPVAPDSRLLRADIAGKSVMVTGAGGSIGADLCRQIIALQPRYLILYEQSEFALYEIEKELASVARGLPAPFPASRIVALLGSVTDQVRLERALESFAVDTIFHAAAYKHVPMVERNPCEGVLNNIIGTYRTTQAALNQGVESFVLISTDKAVRPTNTMGTTKRFAELILQSLAETMGSPTGKGKTRFTIVRFGNVLGSSGSVVPLFREQISRGGPVTVTDPRIVRYFMTIPEATQLVIQAGAMGRGGDIFVLDMGEPVKILDLARRMIGLSGLHVQNEGNPIGDIEIVFTGLRPGEKLYEELLIGANTSTTEHPRILRANEKYLPIALIRSYLDRLEKLLAAGNSDEIRLLLIEAVEEFNPQCGNEDLLQTHFKRSPITDTAA
jgi:FlaA1/EpsC-like NDP-sugar epimerase